MWANSKQMTSWPVPAATRRARREMQPLDSGKVGRARPVRSSGFVWNIQGKPKKAIKQRIKSLLWFKSIFFVCCLENRRMWAEQGERRPIRNLREGGDHGDASGWDSGVGKGAFLPIPLGEETYLENN